MKKLLPIQDPISDSYAHVGMEFSIFLSDEKYYPWIINNYIQIFALKDLYKYPLRIGALDYLYNRYGDWQMFEFSANPYLEYEKISYSTLNQFLKYEDLSTVLENAINEDKYLYLPIDEFEIPAYQNYRKSHIIHHMFICGYDNEQMNFFAFDNFNHGKYQFANIKYEDINKGYYSLFENNIYEWSEVGGLCMFRFYQKLWHRDKVELYSINLETIRVGVCEYLLLPGYGNKYRHISHYRYGIDCYDELDSLFKHGIESEACVVDHRAFCAMRDHKRVMLFRLDYLQEKYGLELSEIIQQYQAIFSSFQKLILKILKGNRLENRSIHKQNKQTLVEIKKHEIQALNAFLNVLINYQRLEINNRI